MKPALLLPISMLATACGTSDEAEPGPGPAPDSAAVLEIGARVDGANGSIAFSPWRDGDPAVVVLGANALNMIQPSLRVRGGEVDPSAPDPEVTVTVGESVMAADIEGARANMQQDGADGHVLWDLRVPFQTRLCCYACRDGVVHARLTDAAGRVFERSVTVRMERAECPDPTACCGDAGVCPEPDLTLVCE